MKTPSSSMVLASHLPAAQRLSALVVGSTLYTGMILLVHQQKQALSSYSYESSSEIAELFASAASLLEQQKLL